MASLLLLIPLTLVLLGACVWAFFWAVDHGQFEELDRAAGAVIDPADETAETT